MNRQTITINPVQISVLEQAEYVWKRDNSDASGQRLHMRAKVSMPGWFRAERHELCDVRAYVSTCKALCGKGMLQYQIEHEYRDHRTGRDIVDMLFCITPAGLCHMAELRKQGKVSQ